MNLSKKQVKAFLDVISKDDTRPVLCHAKIDTYDGRPVLVGTDSYKLAAIKLDDTVLSDMGALIPRSELIKWYKLASNKDYLTESNLLEMVIPEDRVGKYPDWQRILPKPSDNVAIPMVRINASFLLTMQILADCNDYNAGMAWEFNGDIAPVVSHHNDNLYIVMPLKK